MSGHIEKVDRSTGLVLLRDGLTLAFFSGRALDELSDGLIAALDLFVEAIPADTLAWAVVSATAEEWRELTPALMKRMRDSLKPPGVGKRKRTAILVNDAADAAPRYSFTVAGGPRDERFPEARTWVQMTFPPAMAENGQTERTFELVLAMARLLQPDYGYCAPALVTSATDLDFGYASAKGIALRHPGYDVEINRMSRLDIGGLTRGARWITLLGPELTRRLRGIAAIRAALPPPIDVRDEEGVVVIRAGAIPELGDTNRRQDTPLLRAVARLLEPVTKFGEIDLLSYFADFDEDLLRRWERRFLD
ncbi:type VI immunity family protein [Pseudoduganella namucuonensis]|uniref:DUF3396 domain-containing protein n=1 Tax=Pseudoduganella namucuonensis TaxID=1035707 RepID=A0A1I7KPX2_9BURK|nr:type VI immunity family protein [Pseudoduganella namucuonensis]SFU99461.1 Protein of unknown function [Pseudoduganella namucuonensis]